MQLADSSINGALYLIRFVLVKVVVEEVVVVVAVLV